MHPNPSSGNEVLIRMGLSSHADVKVQQQLRVDPLMGATGCTCWSKSLRVNLRMGAQSWKHCFLATAPAGGSA